MLTTVCDDVRLERAANKYEDSLAAKRVYLKFGNL